MKKAVAEQWQDEHGNDEVDDDDDELISRCDEKESNALTATNAVTATRTTMTANCDESISKAATKTNCVLFISVPYSMTYDVDSYIDTSTHHIHLIHTYIHSYIPTYMNTCTHNYIH